eukprot:comp23599_c1_seq2/m.40095 comp23599_c1_seq2/g.40095  ORF comp23599_c1_seq2/g.40095 comp23599_c1_seq2/m.40095 type:complete len:593 (-) comp23599_c1_seq2:682-2460(-)
MCFILIFVPHESFASGQSKVFISTFWATPPHCDSVNCHGRGPAGEPLLVELGTRDSHDAPLSIQEENEIQSERQAEADGHDMSHGVLLLTREEKDRIAFHLQDVIMDYQADYVGYMQKHRYQWHGPRPTDNSTIVHPGPLAVLHTQSCQAHEPGLVRTTHSTDRGYCFGTAKIAGERVCDQKAPNYLSVAPGQKFATFMLYNRTFGYVPYYHTSRFTARGRKNKDLRTNAITVTSQGSWNRIEHVVHLAKLWRGPISFALLLDNRNQIEELDRILSGIVELSEYLDLHIVWRHDHEMTDPDAFYPINMLRNMGMQPVETGLVFVLDVDNIPNASHDQYARWISDAERSVRNASAAAECPGLDAFVPPAVEMLAPRLERLYLQNNSTDTLKKDTLVDAFFDGTALPMHLYFGPAYVPTNHFAWARSKTVDRLPYVTRFEPYYIARHPVPLFNESFVNRGGNYAQQVYEMNAAGYTLWRLPHAFMVDIPHTKPAPTPAAATAGSTNENSSLEEGKKGATANVQDNGTKQAHHDQDFIAKTWEQFHEYLPHRYRFHVPNPSVTDVPFRMYRRSQEKVVNAMWHMLGSMEATDVIR